MKLYRRLPPGGEHGAPFPRTGASAGAQPRAIVLAAGFTSLVLLALVALALGRFVLSNDAAGALAIVERTFSDEMFWSAIAVGFLAQAIDGALGMAYGIASTSFLLSAGATPAMASARSSRPASPAWRMPGWATWTRNCSCACWCRA